MPHAHSFRFDGNAHNGSAMPRSVVDTSADVWLAECRIEIFDVFDVHGTECRLRLFLGRAGLQLNELILEVTSRKGGDDLVALLWRIFIKFSSENVHEHT